MTGTDEGGKAPNSVTTFFMYSGGVKSYIIFKIFKLSISCQFFKRDSFASFPDISSSVLLFFCFC